MCVCFLDMKNGTVAQSSRVSPGRRYAVCVCGSPWSVGFAACDRSHTHWKFESSSRKKQRSHSQTNQESRNYSLAGMYFFPSCIILWSRCDERGLTSYKFLEAENILPFIWRRKLLTRALLLKFTTLCYRIDSKRCVYV